jgi:hypothetical protein
MKISPQTFFNFCAVHVPLLRGLMDQADELSEADVRRLIRANCTSNEELPETTWRRLKELQILVPSEPGGDYCFMADQVRRLLAYLFDEANAATPEIIGGYILSLEKMDKRLSPAIQSQDTTEIRLALEELQHTLRRIQSDLDETHNRILFEVGRYKTERHGVSIREKFRRIAYWMDRYVDPIVEMVRPDGPLRAVFNETERLLHRARECGLYDDLPGLERNTRHLRILQRHALRIFQQCRRELQPLYESLRRASFIAEGAAVALERLQRDGVGECADITIPFCRVRWQHAFSDLAIKRALQNVTEYRPEEPPTLGWNSEEAVPNSFVRLRWLEEVNENIRPNLPVADLLAWITQQYPERDTQSTLAAFTRLVYATDLTVRFTDNPFRTYQTADGELESRPVQLTFA